MNTRAASVVAAVVVLAVAGSIVPTVTATGTTQPDAPAQRSNATENASVELGSQLTAFMQSSAAAANDSVEAGMWTAAFERANESERARLVERRAGALERRADRLAERNATLTDRYENGSLSPQEYRAYVAQSSALAGRLQALRTSVGDADRAARSAGVNDTRLTRLRRLARNSTGPSVAGVARGVVAGERGPPGNPGAGPPGLSDGDLRPGQGDTDGPRAGDGTGPDGTVVDGANVTDWVKEPNRGGIGGNATGAANATGAVNATGAGNATDGVAVTEP